MEPVELFSLVLKSKGLKQSAVAEKAGITRSAFSQFLNSKATLSTDTLKDIAKELGVNPAWITGDEKNPFKSKELIKMFIPDNFLTTTLDFSLIYHLLSVNRKLDFIFVAPHIPFFSKAASQTVFGTPIYAIAIADGDNNIFIFRRKARSVLSAAIVGDKDLQLSIEDIAQKEGKRVTFRIRKIDDKLYKKIQDWDSLTRKDISPLFSGGPSSRLSDIFGFKDDEIKLIYEMRKKHIKPAQVRKLINIWSSGKEEKSE